MANKTYKWKATTTYQSTTTLSHGVTPADQSDWQTAQPGPLSGSWTYWYRDANVSGPAGFTDANSSRVAISLTESWNATIDNRNNLTISITTTINSIIRDDLRGVNQNTPARNIDIYRVQGGAAILSLTDSQLASAHTIYTGPLVLDQYTFTLAPGENLQRSSLYLHNQAVGYPSYDNIWFGVLFLNDLPAETVPHAVLGSSSTWLSHNRDGGDLRMWNGSRWTDNLANIGGGEDCGDPPSVYKSNKWLNARTFGIGS